jgi:hypothetical protein
MRRFFACVLLLITVGPAPVGFTQVLLERARRRNPEGNPCHYSDGLL